MSNPGSIIEIFGFSVWEFFLDIKSVEICFTSLKFYFVIHWRKKIKTQKELIQNYLTKQFCQYQTRQKLSILNFEDIYLIFLTLIFQLKDIINRSK
jgi:hypothetical protein